LRKTNAGDWRAKKEKKGGGRYSVKGTDVGIEKTECHRQLNTHRREWSAVNNNGSTLK